MDQIATTYLLAAIHLGLYGLALVLTRYPVISVFHFVLAISAVSYGVRPLLSASEGGHTNLSFVGSWSLYNQGLLIQLLFNAILILAYLISWKLRRKVQAPLENAVSLKGLLLSLGLGVGAVAAMPMLSGVAWFATERTVALTQIVPMGRFLFPLAAVSLSVSLVLAYGYSQRPRSGKFVAFGAFCLALFLLTVLYQRGFVISGLILVLWLVGKRGSVGYLKAGLVVLVLMVALTTLRPIAHFIFTGNLQQLVSPVESQGSAIKNALLYSTNFDVIEVWPVTLGFVNDHGLLWGKSILAIPARFMPLRWRAEHGMFTAMDYLNFYYWGNRYLDTNFGFNVIISQELFVNFGYFALGLAAVLGVLTSLVDRWLYALKKLNMTNLYRVATAFAIGGFTSEMGGLLQWGIVFLGLGWGLGFLERLRLTSGKQLPGKVNKNGAVIG
ncbi:MAG: hypothetical protein KGZ53_04385 [Peptococcaceae bacterium]|nr:hypothetical protein [Peptococcaceae bacterium]